MECTQRFYQTVLKEWKFEFSFFFDCSYTFDSRSSFGLNFFWIFKDFFWECSLNFLLNFWIEVNFDKWIKIFAFRSSVV